MKRFFLSDGEMIIVRLSEVKFFRKMGDKVEITFKSIDLKPVLKTSIDEIRVALMHKDETAPNFLRKKKLTLS